LRKILKYHLFEKRDGAVINSILDDEGNLVADQQKIDQLLLNTPEEIQLDNNWGWIQEKEFPKLPRLNESQTEEIFKQLSYNKAVAYDEISDVIFQGKETRRDSCKDISIWNKAVSTLRNLWRINLDNYLKENDSWGSRLVALNKVYPKTPTRKEMRPILIQSPIIKLLEGRFLPKLRKYMQNDLVISQTGFVPGLGTQVNIKRAIERIQERTKNKRPAYGLFIDFSNAFNTVPHILLFEKLRKKKILDEEEISYLEQLYARYRIRVGKKTLKVNKGVAQGSVISPALFNIFIEDLAQELSNKANINLLDILIYADDILTICSSLEQVRTAIRVIEEWCSSNGMILNKKKSGIVIFAHRKANKVPLMKTEKEQKISKMNGKISVKRTWIPERAEFEGIPICKEYKYLGTILNSKLTAGPQINYICKKAAHIYTKLYPFLSNASADGRRDMFITLVMPLFNAATLLLDAEPSESHKLNLERLQRRIFKQFMGISKKTSNELVEEMMRKDLREIAKFEAKAATAKWLERSTKTPVQIQKNLNRVNGLRGVPASWCKLINTQVRQCPVCKSKDTVTSSSHLQIVHGYFLTPLIDILRKEILPITEKKFEVIEENGIQKRKQISRKKVSLQVTPIIEKRLQEYNKTIDEMLAKQSIMAEVDRS